MKVLLTTCCAAKRPDPGLLPAADRYVSPRIDVAKRMARRLDLPLLILSGVHGVLEARQGVPLYDHALQPAEVEALVPRVVARLRELHVTEMALVVRPRGTPGWTPYLDVIDAAIEQLDVPVVRHLVGLE